MKKGNSDNTYQTKPETKTLRIIYVVPAVSEDPIGPSYTAYCGSLKICQELINLGEKVIMVGLDWASITLLPSFIKIFPIGLGPKKLGRSPTMAKWLNEEVTKRNVDIIHNNGMWQMNALYPSWPAKNGKVKLLISPCGTLF